MATLSLTFCPSLTSFPLPLPLVSSALVSTSALGFFFFFSNPERQLTA
jgi:hypothetical protein